MKSCKIVLQAFSRKSHLSMNINKGHVVCIQACTSIYMESIPNQFIAEDILENQHGLNYWKEITEENTRYD